MFLFQLDWIGKDALTIGKVKLTGADLLLSLIPSYGFENIVRIAIQSDNYEALVKGFGKENVKVSEQNTVRKWITKKLREAFFDEEKLPKDLKVVEINATGIVKKMIEWNDGKPVEDEKTLKKVLKKHDVVIPYGTYSKFGPNVDKDGF